jgi:hypothetical protein
MTIPAHVTPAQAVESAVKLVRALSYKRAQQDARARELRGQDAGTWADHAANVYRYELLRALAKLEASQ